MRLLLDFPRYLRRICQGISLSDPRTSAERQVEAAFCLREPEAAAEDLTASARLEGE
jgi:hypothetical protein